MFFSSDKQRINVEVNILSKFNDMNAISPWAIDAANTSQETESYIFERIAGFVEFKVQLSDDSLSILTINLQGGTTIFRAAYMPGGRLELENFKEEERELIFHLSSPAGKLTVTVKIEQLDEPTLSFTTRFIPKTDLFIPFWPRDILVTSKDGLPQNTAGKIHVTQEGTRTGLIYFTTTRPKAGTVMYIQNLSSLESYNQQTETSAGGVVGGQWPELGLSLSPAVQKPLKANKEVILSDAIVIFSNEAPENEPALVRQYLDLLAKLYLKLPKPEIQYNDWPKILELGLHDLTDNPGCYTQVEGHRYFNAYVSDYDTPPEIMVQLAVLLPLIDYVEWKGESLEIIDKVREGLPLFYDPKLGTVKRWHPAREDKLKGDEEQKKPDVMDSWYLHHPMLNLSRMALKGDEIARKLFLDSLGYMIKVARHFNYNWPVFYRMETLEVLKEETQPGKGGEKDVAGIYAHVLLQAYELTNEDKYLREAKKAANTLEGKGFELFYQANNTAFSAGALLRLYKITKEDKYLELSYLCLANMFKNVKLWDCNYGYGKNFPSFFALYPLNDAPYTAVYEEQEVFCAFHEYLQNSADIEIPASIPLLLSEYIRYLVHRAAYYYPPILPKEMLSKEVKVGEVDPNLWIALEDLHDGWEQSGEVGQEVYGAGNAFGILPRHYLRVPDKDFLIFSDYPKGKVTIRKQSAEFKILGDARLHSHIRIVSKSNKSIAGLVVKADRQGEIGPDTDENGLDFFTVSGDQIITVSWK